MTGKCADVVVGLRLGIEVPELDQIVATTSDKTAQRLGLILGCLRGGQLSWKE